MRYLNMSYLKLHMVVLALMLLSYAGLSAQQTYTLQELKDLALQNNIAVSNARHNMEAARLQRKEAFTKYFPSVSATGFSFEANRGMAKMEIEPAELFSDDIGAVLSGILPAEALSALGSPIGISMLKNGSLAGVTALQPIFAGGQIVTGNKLAKIGEEVSALQFQLSENEVELQTEQYYWQLVSLQEKLKTLDAVDSLLATIHKDVDIAVRAGVAMRNDLLQVQLRRSEIESQRVKLDNGIYVVSLLMAQYCGLDSPDLKVRSPFTDNLLSGSVRPVEQPDSAVHLQSAYVQDGHISQEQFVLERLPEYQLLEKQLQAADLQIRMAKGQNLPTVALGAGYAYHNLLDNDRRFGMVFATVSIPISDWWGGSYAVRRRKLEQQKAQDQPSNNAQLLTIRMQKAWNDVVEAGQSLAIAQKSIEQAEENLRLNRDYYKVGISKMSDLLEAQMLYQQTKDNCTDAYARLHTKLLIYRQSLGR